MLGRGGDGGMLGIAVGVDGRGGHTLCWSVVALWWWHPMVLCFCAVNSVFTQLCMLGTVLFIVYKHAGY